MILSKQIYKLWLLPSLVPRLSPRANEKYRFSVLQVTESWAGPGNKASCYPQHELFSVQANGNTCNTVTVQYIGTLCELTA